MSLIVLAPDGFVVWMLLLLPILSENGQWLIENLICLLDIRSGDDQYLNEIFACCLF